MSEHIAMPDSLGEQIVAAARDLLGTRFYHTGRDANGVDCAGLVLAAWKAVGLTDWDDRNYAPGGDAERLQAGLTRFCDRVDRQVGVWVAPAREAQLLPGDVLLFAIGRQPVHCGISTGEGTFIHCLEQPGRVVEVPLDSHWSGRLISVWRWRG